METKILVDVPFTFDVELKAVGADVVHKLENGDLLIEGWGATLDVDREDEAFTDGAFTKGLKKFLSGGAPLCWHHKYDQVIGKIVHAERIPGRGVWLKAVVDRQPETSPLFPAYQAIKKGRANGLSVGGIFKRVMTELGPRINDVDIMEWSATATPVGSTATFSVVAGKALEFKADGVSTEVTNEETSLETAEVVEPVAEEVVEPVAEEVVEPAVEEEPTNFVLGDAAVTAQHIAPGVIGTEHLSDELRSRFSELKEPEQPTVADLNNSLAELSNRMTQVFDKIGMEPQPSSAAETS